MTLKCMKPGCGQEADATSNYCVRHLNEFISLFGQLPGPKVRNAAHHLIQLGLLAFGAAGAWMISGPAGSPGIVWGFALLLVSQIFWFLDVFRTRPLRWGVLLNVVFYTLVWIRGFYNYF